MAKQVIAGICKHGKTVGFCALDLAPEVVLEFCMEPTYRTLIKGEGSDPQMAAGFCAECVAES